MHDSRIAARLAWGAALLAAAAIGCVALGWFLEPELGWAAFAALLLGLLLHHARQMLALGRWLEHGDTPGAARAIGVWDELHAVLHRTRRESAVKKTHRRLPASSRGLGHLHDEPLAPSERHQRK